MSITVECQGCSKQFKASPEYLDKPRTCPQCGELLVREESKPPEVGETAEVEPPIIEVARPIKKPTPAKKAREPVPRVVIAGIRIPLADAIRLIVTFWLATFCISLAAGFVGFLFYKLWESGNAGAVIAALLAIAALLPLVMIYSVGVLYSDDP